MSPDAVEETRFLEVSVPGAGFGCWGFFFIMESEQEMIMGIQSVSAAETTPAVFQADRRRKQEIDQRRTFGIISHPDAGKTTLTEKLLLFGGAIQLAGAVKARKAGRHAMSDWMAIEKERGISVTTSVMKFHYDAFEINLLDTPGHQDFSEDTYRVLTAVDSALMVIDSGKGVEPQTEKLMEVCRMRNTPIMTFINKLDRDGMAPMEILANIEDKLQIECAPLSWPIGMGKDFKGVYNLYRKSLHLFTPGKDSRKEKGITNHRPRRSAIGRAPGEPGGTASGGDRPDRGGRQSLFA